MLVCGNFAELGSDGSHMKCKKKGEALLEVKSTHHFGDLEIQDNTLMITTPVALNSIKKSVRTYTQKKRCGYLKTVSCCFRTNKKNENVRIENGASTISETPYLLS